jgi:hypothetical protein
MNDGTPRPDHGTGYLERVCADCGASWVGHEDEPCYWCERATARLLEDERSYLLHPPHLRSSAGQPRYDELGDDSRAVWDRTRGQTRGTGSLITHTARLGRAVTTGLLTPREAELALRRVTQ